MRETYVEITNNTDNGLMDFTTVTKRYCDVCGKEMGELNFYILTTESPRLESNFKLERSRHFDEANISREKTVDACSEDCFKKLMSIIDTDAVIAMGTFIVKKEK